jgi:hypothetical protein
VFEEELVVTRKTVPRERVITTLVSDAIDSRFF